MWDNSYLSKPNIIPWLTSWFQTQLKSPNHILLAHIRARVISWNKLAGVCTPYKMLSPWIDLDFRKWLAASGVLDELEVVCGRIIILYYEYLRFSVILAGWLSYLHKICTIPRHYFSIIELKYQNTSKSTEYSTLRDDPFFVHTFYFHCAYMKPLGPWAPSFISPSLGSNGLGVGGENHSDWNDRTWRSKRYVVITLSQLTILLSIHDPWSWGETEKETRTKIPMRHSSTFMRMWAIYAPSYPFDDWLTIQPFQDLPSWTAPRESRAKGNAELSRKLSLVAQRHHRLSTDQNSIGFAKSNRLSLVHHSTLDYCRRICANQGRKQYVGMIGQDLLSAALIKEKMVLRRKLMCRTLFSCSYIITDLAEAVQHGIISPQWSIKGAEVRRHLLTCIFP